MNPKEAGNPTIGADFTKDPYVNANFCSQGAFSGESKWLDCRINRWTLPKVCIKVANSGMRTIRTLRVHRGSTLQLQAFIPELNSRSKMIWYGCRRTERVDEGSPV